MCIYCEMVVSGLTLSVDEDMRCQPKFREELVDKVPRLDIAFSQVYHKICQG